MRAYAPKSLPKQHWIAPMNPTVLIVDDHAVVAEGLELYLENNGIRVVGRAGGGQQALALAAELKPDVVLLDITLPDLDGLQVLSALKSNWPDIHVLMMTASGSRDHLIQAISLGASGYVLKSTSLAGIPHAIQAAVSGHAAIDLTLLQTTFNNYLQSDSKPRMLKPKSHKSLTEQELRVLKLIAQGMDNDAIAEKLVVSRNTVKSHVGRILKKLEVSDRTQAAIWAIRQGISR